MWLQAVTFVSRPEDFKRVIAHVKRNRGGTGC